LRSKNRILLAVLLVTITTVAHRAGGATKPPWESLKPDQVLVVANADSLASRDLASFYASQRGIPKRNIVLVKTTEKYLISRKSYQETIHRPIIQAMLERRIDRHIRCICLMWGVPVRISESQAKKPTSASEIETFYKTQTKEALAKMTVYHELLALVGNAPSKLPVIPPDRIENVADLFNTPLPPPAKKIPTRKAMFAKLSKAVARRQVKVRFMSDETKKPLAERQLMALQREIYGLRGLIEYTKDVQAVKPPDAKLLTKMLEKAENTLVRIGRTGTPKSITNARDRIKLLKLSGGLRLVAGYTPMSGKSSHGPRRKVNKLLTKTTASLDSELALIWKGDYRIEGSLGNPLHWRIRKTAGEKGKGKTLMTARIDAPSVALARRVITDSIAIEKTGLKGVLYIDSGLPTRFAKAKNNAGYRAYDARFRALHSFVTKHTSMKVVLDTSPGLFAPGKCPNAALYAGWYSLRKYIPAFTWNRGAVGWHTASFEAADLRNPKSRQWCPQMLTNGVAATSGAVDEPLLMAFPAPEEFYPLLMTGKYTLAECYWRTTPRVSWQMTLIADPLYNPFKTNPQVSTRDLRPGLAP
jgi:uncharacterized protein (TIGR03790 family)